MARLDAGAIRAESPLAYQRRRWRRRIVLSAVLAAGLVGCYLLRGYALPAAARFLDVSEPPHRVDYVMVLGGGSDSRPFVAAALVRVGLAGQVLLASVRDSPETEDGHSPNEVELVKSVLKVRSVPDDAVVIMPGPPCDSTFDEAQALARFLADRPTATVAIVTNSCHTRRAGHVFRKALGDRFGSISFVATPPDRFDESNWWRFESGFMTYANEYLKLAYYYIRY